MKNRILAILLTACMLLTLLPAGALAAEVVNEGGTEVPVLITGWEWFDPNGNLNEGALALPDVGKESPASFDGVVSMLPERISATVNDGDKSEEIAPDSWVCEAFRQDENGDWPVQGKYAFSAVLPEGYALATDASPLEIKVTLGGVDMVETQTGITYLDENGTAQTCASAIVVSSADSEWNAGWYVANGDIQIDRRVAVTGAVHLILADGCNLTVNGGVDVAGENSFFIYAQSEGAGSGAMTANGGDNSTGIGGGNSGAVGTIGISGGTVTAKGGSLGAGIGGGIESAGGTIEISGGTVIATSNGGAGIGGGGYAVVGGTIGISGGTVTATSSEGAGIGSGASGAGGTVEISGGMVTARSYNGAGIGGGSLAYTDGTIEISGGTVTATSNGGAGIGGGINGAGGTIEIGGGTVNATSEEGAGIGGGHYGAGGEITITGGIVKAASTIYGAGIGGGGGGVGGTIEISDGTIITSSDYGAGIGGGIGGAGGIIEISGGTVAADSEVGAGIGGGSNGGANGTFTTGAGGHAFIVASSISDSDNTTGWSGVIFQGADGLLYGSPVTLTADAEILPGTTLTIGDGQTLALAEGVTLINIGAIVLDGGASLTGGIVVTPPQGGKVEHTEDGGLLLPGGSTVKADDVIVTIPAGGGEVNVNDDGTLTVPSGSTVQVGDGDVVTVPDGGGTVDPSDGSVTANTHTVDFDSQGGSAVAGATVTHGGKAAKPADPTRSGYTFGGWYKESSYTTAWDFESDTVTANVTLYAKWTQNSSGGSGSGSTSSRPSAKVDGEGGKVTTRNGTATVTPDEGYQIKSITVNGKEVDIPKDGKLTGLKRADKVVVTFEKIPVTPETPTVDMSKYTDLDAGAWYYEAVSFVMERGLMNGTSDTTFTPDSPMTRAMLVTVLYRAAGEPRIEDEIWGYPFADVDAESWYGTAVYWARLKGVTSGTGEETFSPDGTLTREQLAAMLWRYADSPAATGTLDGFNDAAKAGSYATDALKWAVEQGILTGKGNGILDPKGEATRAQVAAMLMRYLQRESV